MRHAFLLAAMLTAAPATAGDLRRELTAIDARTDGVVGACVGRAGRFECVNGDGASRCRA